MKRTAILSAIFILLPLCVSAQGDVCAYIQQLAGSAPLNDAVWGICARTIGGNVIAEYNEDINMVPASTTKVLTCGTALNALGADYRYRTKIGYSGTVEDGRLKGDLYIIGGCDPTTGSPDRSAILLQATFTRWRSMLTQAGITAIDGLVIGDSRALQDREIPGWDSEDLGFYYGAIPEGLNFYENVIDYRVTPGAAVGDSITISQIFPRTPWLNMTNSGTTGPAGTGDALYYYNSGLAPVAEMSGYYGIDRAARTESCSNRFGAYTCAHHFREFLQSAGIASEACADIDMRGMIRTDLNAKGAYKAAATDSITVIGESYSPTIDKIVKEVLHRSDNFYAETLLKTIGLEYTGSACYDSCRVAERRLMKDMGVNADRVRLQDGSGLSRRNFISPEFFVDFLTAMAGTEVYGTWLTLFPIPGEGTLYDRMSSAPYELKSRIRMKSGSMGGVRAYCGYILPKDGKTENTVVFSVITNNALESESGSVKRVLDRLIARLAQ